MEGVLAAFAQFDNDVRSDRTRGGMRAALELGRWRFLAPIVCKTLKFPAGKDAVELLLETQERRDCSVAREGCLASRHDHSS